MSEMKRPPGGPALKAANGGARLVVVDSETS